MNKGFIASGDRSNGHYGEPKARVLERGGELRDVTIVGTDASGKPQIWSTLPDDRSNGHYGEPKARVLERGGELRDVTIVGTDASGKPQIWSTLPDDQVESVFKTAFPALAELTAAE
jgi:class 3 adenylate cyclase